MDLASGPLHCRGQMCVEEDFTTVDGTTLTQTGTTYALGARGIDMLHPYSVDTSNWTRTYDAPHFPIYDGHGNMVATLTRNGQSYAVGNGRQYDVWGGVRAGASTGDPNTRYCANLGHKQDDESGLIYMRARYYEPGTGRFISEDPARDGDNWYSYCRNNPIGLVDDSGCNAKYNRVFGAIFGLVALLALLEASYMLSLPPHATLLLSAAQWAATAVALMTVALAFSGIPSDPYAAGIATLVGLGVAQKVGSAVREFHNLINLMTTNAAFGEKSLARGAVHAAFIYSLVVMSYLIAINFADPWLN